MINSLKLRTQAAALETILRRYAANHADLGQCLRQLEPLFRELAKPDGYIDEDAPVPCARLLGDGAFEPWPDLLEAYSAFYVTLKDLGDVTIPED